MITWMQRHKKYLIITIWISTIAFVGAGFVGWGQYSYGDKAGAIAKVGSVEITMGELQKSYSNLYNQYSQMFQGEFDEEKAKSFGLKSQALQYLVQQALILNLAKSYDLQISDAELLNEIKTQEYFFKDGVFDKETYIQVLLKNNLSIKEFEADIKKDLLIKKTLNLLPVQTKESEQNILKTSMNIADKIEYKLLEVDQININTSDELLKPFWGKMKSSFMSEVSYDVKYIKQPKISQEYDEMTITQYYNENKLNFKNAEGKVLSLEEAKDKIVNELDAKESKKEALRGYIAYKKGELEGVDVKSATISISNNPFGKDAIDAVSNLTPLSPFSKPVQVADDYFTFELVKINKSQPKNYEDAKSEVVAMYVEQEKRIKLLELAKKSFATFKGKITDFITVNDFSKLTDLSSSEANEFMNALITKESKKGYITLESGNIVMYSILEQKLLTNDNNDQNNVIARLKSAMFNEGLIKNLQNKYKTEIFIEGL
ncbi:peptidylprolyl isomerase [Sulfurimonas sp.]|jgi:peptidyl-prolyl cis-trans isomerase D|uniref:peptidylprolyl isomerase n=1 Tax=Sulfurimonas sp. TaxID=2022749 RepID=UPI0025F732EC|nr:peptidylprolyl isomerase [Sulfurimonas sp.]MCK9473042.1 peptidylprolyl isomerase [Sulfurimonas sp.]MDD3505596.1 peptidylprolyl isomerase [Sulfurimonas sp.]